MHMSSRPAIVAGSLWGQRTKVNALHLAVICMLLQAGRVRQENWVDRIANKKTCKRSRFG